MYRSELTLLSLDFNVPKRESRLAAKILATL